jgi:hypothetical protein
MVHFYLTTSERPYFKQRLMDHRCTEPPVKTGGYLHQTLSGYWSFFRDISLILNSQHGKL